MSPAGFELDFSLLVRESDQAWTPVTVRVPSERPFPEDVILARRAEHSSSRNVGRGQAGHIPDRLAYFFARQTDRSRALCCGLGDSCALREGIIAEAKVSVGSL